MDQKFLTLLFSHIALPIPQSALLPPVVCPLSTWVLVVAEVKDRREETPAARSTGQCCSFTMAETWSAEDIMRELDEANACYFVLSVNSAATLQILVCGTLPKLPCVCRLGPSLVRIRDGDVREATSG